jgi:hypothetical protein
MWNMMHGEPVSIKTALRLVERIPGLTLDWIYLGKPDGLPLHLAKGLAHLRS